MPAIAMNQDMNPVALTELYLVGKKISLLPHREVPVRFTDGEAANTMAQRLSRRDSDFPNLFSREFP